jgi:hypothetical protein
MAKKTLKRLRKELKINGEMIRYNSKQIAKLERMRKTLLREQWDLRVGIREITNPPKPEPVPDYAPIDQTLTREQREQLCFNTCPGRAICARGVCGSMCPQAWPKEGNYGTVKKYYCHPFSI